MKKVKFLLAAIFAVVLLQSCKQIEECPAIGQQDTPTEDVRS
ncbi:MAG: PBP1b-binding outer membrane lipoprotein LpoB [Flavobacteriales bacterium]|jgi:PBP1b-binding outer membrane lipoprotein LpoB